MSKLTHFDTDGNSRMVDVGLKPATRRTAVASGLIQMKSDTLRLIKDHQIQKGDVLEVARLAGIMSTKRTSELIPLCHPLRLDSVQIEFTYLDEASIRITATVAATDRTGVEMEALTAVSIAGLTVYDMCKAVDRSIVLTDICLTQKTGGKTGDFDRASLDQQLGKPK
jgi:cyclic pyranopterin phosphate synthase